MTDGSNDTAGPPTTATGGCQCGAVRYTIRARLAEQECNVCHCRMCQKASGGPFMVFVNLPAAAVTWTRGEPTRFASSSLASRGFCKACGTPLTYERTADRISVSHGSLDDPAAVVPTTRLGSETVLAWSEAVGTIPIQSAADWLASLGPTPVANHQHPDHDL